MMSTMNGNNNNAEDEVVISITMQEEKELRRVFDHLCDFSKKARLNRELLDLKQVLACSKLKGLTGGNSTEQMQERLKTEARIDAIATEIAQLDSSVNPKKVTVADVYEKLKELNQKINRKDVEEMVWEVDEDLDQALDWDEFKLMFTRNIADKSGLEPSRMYNLTQFMIYDHNNSGLVSVDKTMNMLYARYGRFKMELKLKELFGEDMHETGVLICLRTYMHLFSYDTACVCRERGRRNYV